MIYFYFVYFVWFSIKHNYVLYTRIIMSLSLWMFTSVFATTFSRHLHFRFFPFLFCFIDALSIYEFPYHSNYLIAVYTIKFFECIKFRSLFIELCVCVFFFVSVKTIEYHYVHFDNWTPSSVPLYRILTSFIALMFFHYF